MSKRALITGICGMDGSHLADLLLDKDYEIFGVKRRTSADGYDNIRHLLDDITILEGDLLDQSSLNYIIREIQPDECYHLGAQSHVGTSFSQPVYTAECTGLGSLRLLEAIKEFSPATKTYIALTSETFGGLKNEKYNEQSPLHSRSPYGTAKIFAYYTALNYREAYNLFISNGFLFNHESPRRGESFVTRKITKAAAAIKLGLQNELRLGNLDAKRDITHAKDMVKGMYLMLQHNKPEDFVLASGETHSIKEMLEVVFGHLELDWQKYVKVDQAFMRPSEVPVLCGDSSKAHKILGWQPKYTWKELLVEMIEHDLKQQQNI